MLITPEYQELSRTFHVERADYVAYSARWAQPVMQLCAELETMNVLDYGCGKANLNLHLPFEVQCYDPAIPKHDEAPSPADIVVCTDVLEHIEPECLDDVIEHLHGLTKMALFLNVATRPAKKELPDGRNAHLIIETFDWWYERLSPLWVPRLLTVNLDEFTGTWGRRRN